MVQYVITPWRNRQELLDARSQLYAISKSPSERKRIEDEKAHAVAKISVWVQRGNCPHLVESTAILTSAMLNDVPGNSVYCVRAAYSAAFCRFVTGILDSHQDKKRKMSMYAIAKTIGLPATYVELRHQATHEELPSLSKLRAGTQKALRWIWEYYWVHLSEIKVEGDGGGEDGCKALVQRVLREGNEGKRRKLEKGLEEWDEERVLGVLMEVQGETRDPGVLIRLVRLQERMLTPASSAKGSEKGEVRREREEGSESLDQLRAEMAGMEQEFGSDEEEEEEEGPMRKRRKGNDVSESKEDMDSPESQGWAMWEGPWVPKPIGVV